MKEFPHSIRMSTTGLLLLHLMFSSAACAKKSKALSPVEDRTSTSSAEKQNGLTSLDLPDTTRLLTPEQFGRHIRAVTGLDLAQGKLSPVQRYLLPLGGIDHDTVLERDRELKVQTLLAIQALAWEAAQKLIVQEQTPAKAKIFINKNPKTLTPTSDLNAWNDQLEEIYLMFYNRPPQDAEKKLFTSSIKTLLDQGASPLQGWTMVLYTILASVEFWTI